MENSDWDTDTEEFPVPQQQAEEKIQVTNQQNKKLQKRDRKFKNSNINHMSIFFEKEIQIIIKEIKRGHSEIGVKTSRQDFFKRKINKLESDEQTEIKLRKIDKFQRIIESLE